MNVVFLDIDGVLNSQFWNEEHQKEISELTLIDCEKVELLSLFVQEFSAKIILHSGWKYWFDEHLKPLRPEAARLVEILKSYGLSIDGLTPDFADDEIKRTKKFSLVKAKEILAWVDANLQNVDSIGTNRSDSWVVLDDLDLNNGIVMKHQVRTNNQVGLTNGDLNKARSILGYGYCMK